MYDKNTHTNRKFKKQSDNTKCYEIDRLRSNYGPIYDDQLEKLQHPTDVVPIYAYHNSRTIKLTHILTFVNMPPYRDPGQTANQSREIINTSTQTCM